MSRAPVQSRSSLPASDGLESSHPTCSAESQKEGTARLEGEAARLGELFPYASPLTAGCGVSPALEDQARCSSSLANPERTWAHRANCGPSQSRTFHQALCFRWHHKGRKEWLFLSEDSSVYFVRTSKSGKTVRAGPCGQWRCMEDPAELHGGTGGDPPVQWLRLLNFNCTGCGNIPTHNLNFLPGPGKRQPAILHGEDGRRIELYCALCLESFLACTWSWPSFDQAVRRPVFLDYASLADLRQLGHQGTEPVEPLLAPLSSAASAHGWTFLEEGCSQDLDSPEEAGRPNPAPTHPNCRSYALPESRVRCSPSGIPLSRV